jgi:TfoX/Sxy family transcriptional regulator of competence genes
MSYDTRLVERVRERLDGTDGVTELTMFGGWGITVHGNMAVGVLGDDLIVRVGPDAYDDALARRGARPFDFTGRPMRGWVYVASDALREGRTLSRWVASGVAHAETLPAKTGQGRRPRSRSRTSRTRQDQ